jgi:mRNA-degrading endonuclease toxin of MazEF toxin-antitoxin module
MRPGDIVTVDWRDALPGSGEPNKRRPAVVVSSPRFFGTGLPYEIVVPLTGEATLAIAGATTVIEPTRENISDNLRRAGRYLRPNKRLRGRARALA